MSSKFTIFAVDDDEMIRDILKAVLEPAYELETFASAEKCRARMAEHRPDCLLLDIGLPGMDGYQFCRLLKNEEDTSHLPITFISSHDTIDSRLMGYDAGGDDFIVKPFEPAELLRKLKVAENLVAAQHQLLERLEDSDQLSSIALASMSDSGILLQFMSQLIGWDDEQEIAHGTVRLLSQFSLDGVVQTRIGDRIFTVRGNSINAPLEVSVLNHVRSLGRIFEFRNRGVYNHDRITIMINNMPIDDSMLCGRIRDNLAIAAQGAAARLESLETEAANRKSQEGITRALSTIESTLDAITKSNVESQYQHTQLIYQFDMDLEKTIIVLGLSDAQENQIANLVRGFTQRLMGQMEQGEELQRSLSELTAELHKLRT